MKICSILIQSQSVISKVTSFLKKVGKAYTVRETSFADYVNDLQQKNHNGMTSYMAVQNISKTFPQLQVI